MKKIFVKCHKIGDNLEGICKFEEKNVYVKNMLVDEEAFIEVTSENDSVIKGTVLEYKKSNPNRVKPKCLFFESCGGCNLMHLNYDYQVDLKHQFCKDKLKYLTKLDSNIYKSKNPLNYRNKIVSCFKRNKKGQIVSALYEENSRTLISVRNCLIQDDLGNRILDSICEILNKLKVSLYGERDKKGVLKFVLIRIARKTNAALVCFVVNDDLFPARNEISKLLREKHPEIITIIQNTNNRDTSVLLGEKERIIFGKGFIYDEILGKKFKITSKSFYQINLEQTEVLYKNAVDCLRITKKDVVLDAYSGIGTIGIILSGKAKEVFSIELNKESHKNAIENAKLNEIKNIHFYNEDATSFICGLEKNEENKIDIVILDPPREGSTPEFLKAIMNFKPRKILYISCNVITLERDLNLLKESEEYEIKKLFFVDLFCNTFHVETVVLLELRK